MARRFLLARRLDNSVGEGPHLHSCLVFSRQLSDKDRIGSKQLTNPTEEKRRALTTTKEIESKECNNVGTLYSSDEDEYMFRKWKLEDTWLSKAVEPALQMFKRITTDSDGRNKIPPSSRSLTEIFSDLQRNKIGLQDWSIGDLTVGLYLVYLRQASIQSQVVDDGKGVLISSDSLVHDLIYHIELAKGAYKGNASSLARHSMLQEKNILKFVKDSSIMRPGYYIGIDDRHKLVVFGIRGTHTVYDIITDVITSSDTKDVLLEGFSTHFGTAVAARWFLLHELQTIKQCLDKNKGFRLRLVGHSLGGATAALIAIMLQKKSQEELGFDPSVISAVGFGTPPCLSKDLAQACSNFVSTVVMQDDIIPRLSTSSLMRLRNEIIQTDWTSFLEREDWRTVLDWISNAKQAVSTVQDVARKISSHANLKNINVFSDFSRKESSDAPPSSSTETQDSDTKSLEKAESEQQPEELYVPGALYYLKKQAANSSFQEENIYTLWRMQACEQIPRILLSGNLISDHRCDSHYYALREVLKRLPVSDYRSHF